MDPVELPVRIVSSNNKNQDSINFFRIDPVNPSIFVSNCGQRSDDFKMYSNEYCDEIRRF